MENLLLLLDMQNKEGVGLLFKVYLTLFKNRHVFLPNAKTITWRYEKHPKVQLTAEIIFQDYKGMQKLSISV